MPANSSAAHGSGASDSGASDSAANSSDIYVGSAAADAPANRGWLLGHFMPGTDPRHSTDVEVKWGAHVKGDRRAQWVTGETRTALILLVSGRFRLEFPGRSVLLGNQGDYVLFRRVAHSWYAEEESVIIGVRWPSVPGYAILSPSQEQPG